MRTDWSELPADLLIGMEAETGPVAAVEPAATGNHADIASTVHTADGRVFVKAARKASPDQDGPEVRSLRREAAINPHVSEFAPRLLWTVEAGGWLALGFEHVKGRRADFAPGSADLAFLMKVIHAIQATPCPDVVRMAVERRWQSIAQDVTPMSGGALLHTDLNEDNFIITPDGRPYVVDWAFAARGAPWVELALLIPWLILAGHSPGEADEWASHFVSWADAKPEHIDRLSLALAENWRINSETNKAAWVVRHAGLTRRWADHRLGR